MMPMISASMLDASRTREDESESICDCCKEDPDTCGREARVCMEEATEDWGEQQFEIRRDGHE